MWSNIKYCHKINVLSQWPLKHISKSETMKKSFTSEPNYYFQWLCKSSVNVVACRWQTQVDLYYVHFKTEPAHAD